MNARFFAWFINSMIINMHKIGTIRGWGMQRGGGGSCDFKEQVLRRDKIERRLDIIANKCIR